MSNNREKSGIPPTTAAKLAHFLSINGVNSAQIGTDQVDFLYQDLYPMRDRPDFTKISKIFPKWMRAPKPISDEIVGLIVETRDIPSLELVISNYLDTVGGRVHLVHGRSNRSLVKSPRFQKWQDTGVLVCSELKTHLLSAAQYNTLFLMPRFWNHIIGRNKIFVFQTDSICCANTDQHLRDFTDYDYIGAYWTRARRVGLIADGGYGGFSIRNWDMMQRCIARFDPTRWRCGEDTYFAFHMELIGGNVANGEACKRFATQEEFTCKSFGAHNISMLEPADHAKFLEYCPEARDLNERNDH